MKIYKIERLVLELYYVEADNETEARINAIDPYDTKTIKERCFEKSNE